MKKRANELGFTLMELMVVIVIVAILAAVAVPLYINYVKDAQRTEAKGAIGAVITAEQTYYQVNNQYASTTFVPNPGPGSQAGLNADLTEALVNWTITVTASGSGATAKYTVLATNIKDGTMTEQYDYDRTPPGVSKWTP